MTEQASDEIQARLAEYQRELQASNSRFLNIIKRNEEAIHFQTQLLQVVQQAIIAVDLSYRIVYWNRSAEELFGWTSAEVIDRCLLEESGPGNLQQQLAEIIPLIQAGQTWSGEFFVRRRDGATFPALGNIAPIHDEAGKLVGYVFVSIDMGVLKQAEWKIHHRNHDLGLLNKIIAVSAVSRSPAAVLELACSELARIFALPLAAAALFDADGTVTAVVPENQQEQASSFGRTIFDPDNPAWQYVLAHRAGLVLEGERSRCVVEAGLKPLADGPFPFSPDRSGMAGGLGDLFRESGQLCSLLLLPILVEDQVIGGLALGSLDPRPFQPEEVELVWRVADQAAGLWERANIDRERFRLSAAIEQTADSVIITDAQGTVLYVNPAFERISGWLYARAIGQNLRVVKNSQQGSTDYDGLWSTISSGQVWRGRFTGKSGPGQTFTLDTTITPVRDKSGAIVNYVAVERDMTRELRLEEQYSQAQKMEAIGLLAGGIAHDFNNLLTAINGFADLLKEQLAEDDTRHELVDKILSSGARAADLIRQLLAFSRKQVIEPHILNLNHVVSDMNKILHRVIGEHIQIELDLAPDIWSIRADLAQIEQVVVNLAVNARDAMFEGGTLSISTKNITLSPADTADWAGVQPGDYVELRISDTGIGMNNEVKDHLFEPFFTTKEPGRGTGLGLSIVFGIVKQNGGHILVESEPGQGTSFKAYLPRTLEQDPAESLQKAGENTIPSGTETILLVEDDIHVRELARRVLEGQGYTLLEAADGQEALQLPGKHQGPIHLLLTDVVMPGMSGKDLADRLAEMYPHLKMLYISGYADTVLRQRGFLGRDNIAFLQKPFSPLLLAHRVREVLDES